MVKAHNIISGRPLLQVGTELASGPGPWRHVTEVEWIQKIGLLLNAVFHQASHITIEDHVKDRLKRLDDASKELKSVYYRKLVTDWNKKVQEDFFEKINLLSTADLPEGCKEMT
jgi:hypothetical protein